MEKMPFQTEMTRAAEIPTTISAPTFSPSLKISDWRKGLPVLTGPGFTLRELRVTDAASLFTMLTADEAARFISPPPATIEGFQRFIEWAIRERMAGNYFCFAIVPEGMTTAVGLFQVRSLEPGFDTAEWGFAIGSAFWGSGAFAAGSKLVLNFVFDCVGVHRLEARASIANGRGNGALRKVGAVQEGVLRRSFFRNGEYHDQVLWSILREDWQAQRCEASTLVH
jgi:RimJ/RimL family protein N-acetyltransferase